MKENEKEEKVLTHAPEHVVKAEVDLLECMVNDLEHTQDALKRGLTVNMFRGNASKALLKRLLEGAKTGVKLSQNELMERLQEEYASNSVDSAEMAGVIGMFESVTDPDLSNYHPDDWLPRLQRWAELLRTYQIKQCELKHVKHINDSETGSGHKLANELTKINEVCDKLGGVRKKKTFIKGSELDMLVIPDTKWIVPDLLPEGQTILAGKPKSGKSWLALALSCDIATGGQVLGRYGLECAGDVLYLALEDSWGRLKRRFHDLMGDNPLPDRIDIVIEWDRLDRGGYDGIEDWLKDHTEAGLVVIDTLAKVRPPKNARGDAYEQDYAIMGKLQSLAMKYHVSILCLLHCRKANADDIFDTVSGTLGNTASADVIMVLTRNEVKDTGTLSAIGRDIEMSKFSLCKNKYRWEIDGESEDAETPQDKAMIWLTQYLTGKGAIPSLKIFEDGAKVGINRNRLFEIKKSMSNLKVIKDGMAGGWAWKINGEQEKVKCNVYRFDDDDLNKIDDKLNDLDEMFP